MEDKNAQLYQLLQVYINGKTQRDQKKVVEELHSLFGEQAVPSLIHVLKNDEHFYNRVPAAAILGELGDREAIQPLVESLKQDKRTWSQAVAALAKFNDPSLIEPMILSLDSPAIKMDDGESLVEVIKIILGFGEPAFQALLTHLHDPTISSQVAQALGISKDQRAVEPLINVLHDPTAGPTAANSLAELGGPRAVKPLIQLLKTGPSDKHRKAAAHALSKLKDPRGFQALKKTINDFINQSIEVRSTALMLWDKHIQNLSS